MQTLSSRGLAPCLAGPRLAAPRLHARKPLRQRHAAPVASSRNESYDGSDIQGLEGCKHVVRGETAVARSFPSLQKDCHHPLGLTGGSDANARTLGAAWLVAVWVSACAAACSGGWVPAREPGFS